MIHHVKITSTGPFAYDVEIDGHAVHCSRLHLTMDPRAIPLLEIELPASVVEFEAEAEIEARRGVVFRGGRDSEPSASDRLFKQMLIEELAQDGS